MAALSGVVIIDNQFVKRKVRVYLRSTGELVAETFSSEVDGTWSISGLTTAQHFAVFLDV